MTHFIGLAGVDPNENPTALKWADHFEIPLLIAAFWIMAEWYLESQDAWTKGMSMTSDWLIWGLFLAETSVLAMLVHRRWYYLSRNWINLLIIVGGFPLFWGNGDLIPALRIIRLLVLITIFVHVFDTLRAILGRNQFGTTLLIVLGVLVIFGVLMAGIDPGIKDSGEGIYWAWVTITTVGYGDVVPVTPEGRFLSGVLMLIGIVLVSIITANISAFFVARDKRKIDAEREEKLFMILDEHSQRMARIEKEVQYLIKLKLESQGYDDNNGNSTDPEKQT